MNSPRNTEHEYSTNLDVQMALAPPLGQHKQNKRPPQSGAEPDRPPADRRALGAGDAERNRKYAAELLALAPDVILANAGPELRPFLRWSRSPGGTSVN